jgi:hypothetical protein
MHSVRRSSLVRGLAITLAMALQRPSDAWGERDRFELVGRSETSIQVFRRAMLPGQNGTLVSTETALPIHEALYLGARDVDALGAEDNLDLDFAAWGRLWPTDTELEPRFDGDLQTASVRYRLGPAWVRLGRQHAAGGAARFVRFDGVQLGAAQPVGAFVDAYAGYSVLPRYDRRPTYRHLGSSEGELLRYSVEPLERGEHWLFGGHLGYRSPRANASLSLHEQRESAGLERRNLGVDAGLQVVDSAGLGGSALLELESKRLASLRLWADFRPHSAVELGTEFFRAEPALLLSRTSVLSVFSSDAYDELGGTATIRALRWLRFDTSGYVELYAGDELGSRGEVGARLSSDTAESTAVRVSYARVSAPENGYHSLRTSLGRALTRRLATTLEAYGYFYDQPIAGYGSSSVYSATVSYRALDALELLWGGSLARSPYASLDAQTLLRVNYDFDASRAGVR